MSFVTIQAEFLLDVCRLVQHATGIGFTLTAGELYRTPEQQEIYMKTGRSQTMDSLHLKRLAVDFNIFRDGKLVGSKAALAPLGAYWESLNPLNSWGGNGKKLVDCPHFSRGATKSEWVRVT
jgi:hypothetical protein